MKKIIFTTVILLLYLCDTHGQISANKMPVSSRKHVPAMQINDRTQKFQPSLDMQKINEEDIDDEANDIPPRFGYRHRVNYNLENSGEWSALPDGGKIWRLIVACPGALSINLLYDKFWIPDGAELYIYNDDRTHKIGAITAANNKGSRADLQGFATGLVFGDKITLEYYLPEGIENIGVISIAYVVQGYKYIRLQGEIENSGYGESANCHINVNCSEGANWQSEKNAVALILVNGNRFCTGSLINTTANDFRPLFLTADHCLGGWANDDVKYDAIDNPNLNHWSFYWHYESPGCTNASPTIRSTVGATLKANNSVSDFALLQLTENPRNASGITPYYLGWDRSGSAGTSGVGIHHPKGDIKKISLANQIQNHSGVINWNVGPASPTDTHWDAIFYNGLLERGSSGSPLINNNRKIIGQLHGGPTATCNTYYVKIYGKFSVSWTGNGATDNRRKLQPWLDPVGTNPLTLNGNAPSYPPNANNINASIGCETGYHYAMISLSGRDMSIDMYEWRGTTNMLTITPHPVGDRLMPMDIVRIAGINGGVEVRAHNPYGWSDWKYVGFILDPCPSLYSMSAAPNPANSQLNIDISPNNATPPIQVAAVNNGQGISAPSNNNAAVIYDIKIFSSTGTLVLHTTSASGSVSLDVSGLPSGLYILHVHDGSENPPQTQQIIIAH